LCQNTDTSFPVGKKPGGCRVERKQENYLDGRRERQIYFSFILKENECKLFGLKKMLTRIREHICCTK
jgi:hypothetical protein